MSDAATMERPTPGIGDNSASVGEMIKAEPAVVYRDETVLPMLLAEIEAEIAALPVKLTTASGREAISSLSGSISSRKARIVEAGLALTESWRKQTTAVNTIKKAASDGLDALRDKARQPLTDWENAEKDRKAAITSALTAFAQAAIVPAGSTIESIAAMVARIEAMQIGPEFGDSEERARQDKATALARLDEARIAIERANAERVELEALRKAAAENDAAKKVLDYIKQVRMGMIGGQTYPFPILLREVEEKIRPVDYPEQFRVEIEAARVEAHEHLTEAFKAHMERGQRESAAQAAAEAEARVKAEQEAAIVAERRKTQDAQDALAAEQRKQREAEEAEATRVAAVAAEDARRQADQDHRGAIMRAAKEALMEHAGITEGAAKKAVIAIVAGSIPSVTLKF
jgi:hypothetical protein